MIEAGKFLTVALACISGMAAFYQLVAARSTMCVAYMVISVVLIAVHIAIDEETK